jgi:predicted aspartyl protease
MAIKAGFIRNGYPFIEVAVSSDKRRIHILPALVDTGFDGFLSLSPAEAEVVGLEHKGTTTRYVLADGSLSSPVPIAIGFACLEGDDFMEGEISIADKPIASVGVKFITRSGNTMVLSPKGFFMANLEEGEALLPSTK